MKPKETHFLTPVANAMNLVESRFRQLTDRLQFQDLMIYVRHRQPPIQQIGEYKPGFAALPYVCSVVNAPFKKQRIDHLVQQLNCLERAVAVCLAATSITPKPLSNLLAMAHQYCIDYDADRTAEQALMQRMKGARALGGLRTQAKRDPCRLRFAELLEEHAPDTGWPNIQTAVKTIAPFLSEEILKFGWTILPYQTLPLTLEKWIRRHPVVKKAFRLKNS